MRYRAVCCGVCSQPAGRNQGSHVEREVDPDDSGSYSEPMGRGRPVSATLSRYCGGMLVASADGWGMTLRYVLLLLVHRGTIGAGAWIGFDLVQRLGLF